MSRKLKAFEYSYPQYEELLNRKQKGAVTTDESERFNAIEREILADGDKYFRTSGEDISFAEPVFGADKYSFVQYIHVLQIADGAADLNAVKKRARKSTEELKAKLSGLSEEEKRQGYEAKINSLISVNDRIILLTESDTDFEKFKNELQIFKNTVKNAIFSKGLELFKAPGVIHRIVHFDSYFNRVRPTTGGGANQEQGKVAAQNFGKGFVNKKFVRTIDVNQGMRYEDARRALSMTALMLKYPKLGILASVEIIDSKWNNPIAELEAAGDRAFNFIVQFWLFLRGVIFDYGHPGIERQSMIDTVTGQSENYVSEDYGLGRRILNSLFSIYRINGFPVLKGREQDYHGQVSIHQKFSSGGPETLGQREQIRYNKNNGMATNALTLQYGIGFYFTQYLAIRLIAFISLVIIYGGISPFAAFATVATVGILGILFSQSNIVLGALQYTFFEYKENLITFARKVWFKSMPVAMSGVYRSAMGFAMGMSSLVNYIATGRKPGDEYVNFIEQTDKPDKSMLAFTDMHYMPAVRNLVLIIGSIFIYRSPAVLWSVLYVAFPIVLLLNPFRSNPGFTAQDIFSNAQQYNLKAAWNSFVAMAGNGGRILNKEGKEMRRYSYFETYIVMPAIVFISFVYTVLKIGVSMPLTSMTTVIGSLWDKDMRGSSFRYMREQYGTMFKNSLKLWKGDYKSWRMLSVIPKFVIFAAAWLNMALSAAPLVMSLIIDGIVKFFRLFGADSGRTSPDDRTPPPPAGPDTGINPASSPRPGMRASYETLDDETKEEVSSLVDSVEKQLSFEETVEKAKREMNEFISLYFMKAQSLPAVNAKIKAAGINDMSQLGNISDESRIIQTYIKLRVQFGTDITDGLRYMISQAEGSMAQEGIYSKYIITSDENGISKIDEFFEKTKALEQKAEDIAFKITDSDNIEGRDVVEIEYSTGERLLFYKSMEGTSGKRSGVWYPLIGFADEKGFMGRNNPKGWFVKFGKGPFSDSGGIKDFYGSKALRRTSEMLAGVSAEKESVSSAAETAVAEMDILKIFDLVFGTVTPGKLIQGWINDNILADRRQNSIASSVQFFVEGDYERELEKAESEGKLSREQREALRQRFSDHTRNQALSMMSEELGMKSVIIRKVERDDILSDYSKVKPNTNVPVVYKGVTYNVKVEHYLPKGIGRNIEMFRANPVIKTLVVANDELSRDIPDEKIIKEIYDQVYIVSAKLFAADINGNSMALQKKFGVSGAGMIVYKGAALGDIDVNGSKVFVGGSENLGIFELKPENVREYFTEEGIVEGKAGEIMAKIASSGEFGKDWQWPGHDNALALNLSQSPRLVDAGAAARQMDNEKSKNVSIVKISDSGIKSVIETLWKESEKRSSLSKEEMSATVKIRNLIDSGKDMKKVIELSGADLINADGSVNAELVKKIFVLKFNGVYADLTGVSQDKTREVVETVKEMSNKYGVDAQNYILFNGDNIADNIKTASELENMLESYSIIPVVKIDGDEITSDDVAKAVGGLSNAAVEISKMNTGDEFEKVPGKVVTVFMKDTSLAQKNKLKGGKRIGAAKRYQSTYKRALTSDYKLDIKVSDILHLKDFMSAKPQKADFTALKKAMKQAGIAQNSVVYQYVMRSEEINTDESYASAKAYLRASVENFLEREYIEVKGIGKDLYIKDVSISDRNAVRALLLYMAVNGEELSSEKISGLISEQKLAMSGEEKTISELLQEVNPLINEIIADPVSVSEEKMPQARKAFALMHDSIAGFAFDRMIENTKNGAKISTAAVKGFLQAA